MIRKTKLKDIEGLNKIGNSYKKDFDKLFHLETEINKDFAILLTYEEENAILGFLYALDFGDNIDILYIAVDSNYHGKGIGTNLLKYFVDNYQDTNKTITLEVAENNKKAYNLYKKFDFKIINIRKGYYQGIDAYLMRR